MDASRSANRRAWSKCSPLGLALLLVLGGCSAPRPETPSAPRPESIALFEGPLESYLPSPSLKWAFHLRPRQLLGDPDVARALEPIISEERFRSFHVASGIDLRTIREAWIAEYELGTLYLFDAGDAEREVERRYLDRTTSAATRTTPDPRLRHFTGVSSGRPNALLRFEGHFVAIADGDPTLVKIVRAYAEKRLTRSPPALESLLLAPLHDFDDDPLTAYALGPFETEEPLVFGTVAASLEAHFHEDELSLRAVVLGAYAGEKAARADEARRFLMDKLESPELRALGSGSLRTPTSGESVEVRCGPAALDDTRLADLERCEARASFSTSEVLDRLHRVTGASLGRLAAPRDEPDERPARE